MSTVVGQLRVVWNLSNGCDRPVTDIEVLEGAYRIIYRVSTDRAEVLAVVHAAQQLPPEF